MFLDYYNIYYIIWLKSIYIFYFISFIIHYYLYSIIVEHCFVWFFFYYYTRTMLIYYYIVICNLPIQLYYIVHSNFFRVIAIKLAIMTLYEDDFRPTGIIDKKSFNYTHQTVITHKIS